MHSRTRIKNDLGLSASLRLILLAVLAATGCSIPNLASPDCVAAKPALHEFYSFHVGNDMAFSPENLKLRERFLTPRFRDELATRQGTADPFTVNSDDVPRAFRLAECTAGDTNSVTYDVHLYWKNDQRSDQRTVKVEMRKIGDEWLIDRINN